MFTLSAATRIHDLIEAYPFLIEYLPTVNPRYKLLANPVMRNTVGKVATITQAASIGGMRPAVLLAVIAAEIERRTGKKPDIKTGDEPAGPITDPAAKHEMLKAIIRSLHEGGDFNEAKRQFAELVRDVDASEIAAMEQRLIAEGMPQSEVKRLCDVHVQVFKESIEIKDAPVTPKGHPVHTLMDENRALERLLEDISTIMKAIGSPPSQAIYENNRAALAGLLGQLRDIHLHYLKKENQLFPVLEKHGITGPSQVMWSLDDDIRAMVKKCVALLDADDVAGLIPSFTEADRALRDMIYKEERILFPLALETLSQQEWDAVTNGEREIGYAWIVPPTAATRSQAPSGSRDGALSLDTGSLTAEQINLMLKTLPLDISFVDENDEVRYYSATAERIFPRSPGVIGRKVQNCHPPKSLAIVQRILDDFRAGTRDQADFHIIMNNRFIHIRYFALRDSKSMYRGCLEVTQDVTGIRALTGEKRLLDD